jgi:hypothetical protein
MLTIETFAECGPRHERQRETSTGGDKVMPIRIAIASALLFGALSWMSLGARAESQEDREACTPDVHAHCGDFIPNRELIVQCLKKKMKVISPACRRVMSRPYNPSRASAN